MEFPNAPRSRRSVRSVHRMITEHHKRTSSIFMEAAHASLEEREYFLRTLKNPLERRYARKRIEEAVTDLALQRMVGNERDPLPYVHEHEMCPVNGMRSNTKEEHDVFAPREGFVADESQYAE